MSVPEHAELYILNEGEISTLAKKRIPLLSPGTGSASCIVRMGLTDDLSGASDCLAYPHVHPPPWSVLTHP